MSCMPCEMKVAKLERLLHEAVEERDHYRALARAATENLAIMTSAASSAASSTATALERIQRMGQVVDAAVVWWKGGPHAALTQTVQAWLDYQKTWA